MSKAGFKIPYVDIAGQHAPLKQRLLEAAERVIDSGHFILGERVAEFESRFAALCGVKHAVAVHSGTDALILALRALDIGPGDEVVTAPNSFISTASSIKMAGAVARFADVGPDYNLDPEKLEGALSGKTKAILPVHLTGQPADMAPIVSAAKARGIAVIEDCAQAVLASYKGRPVGSLGTLGCFSLHPLKTLNACGDGGILTTDDAGLAERLRLLRNMGLKTRDECVVWSSNSRLDEMQAAMLLVKLDHLESWTNARQEHAKSYREGLAGIEGITLPAVFQERAGVYHTFVIQAERRDALKEFLAEEGIGTAVHYPIPIHLQPVSAEFGYKAGSFPVAETQAGKILSLPVYPEMRPEDIDGVCRAIRRFYER